MSTTHLEETTVLDNIFLLKSTSLGEGEEVVYVQTSEEEKGSEQYIER